ncbi:mechanosensitive ion channel family protein [Stenotrophomonas sp.]|uniref:mechanosensitive ion channel family protein n=1 Tax=Stenotrophomonas sp. TaxID=69392 RepID=UPI0028AA68C9|nr:mechanosensitive ion channel family protein [Stenotrophomonas sp.]
MSTLLLRRLSLSASLLVLAAWAWPGVAAATPAAPPAPAPTAAAPSATARWFNRDLVTFRASLYGNTPAMRARAAEGNLARIVDQPGHATVSTQNVPQGSVILADGQLVTVLTPADRDVLRNETPAQQRDRAVQRMQAALAAAEQARLPQRLLAGAAWTLLATCVAIAVLWALRGCARRMRRRVDAWVQRRVHKLRSPSARQLLFGLVTSARSLGRLIGWLVVLVLMEEWLRFVLGRFPYTQPWANAMAGWIGERLAGFGRATLQALPDLVSAALIFLAARVVVQAVRIVFEGVASGRFQFVGIDQPLAEPTRKIITVVIWLFALAMAYPYLPGAETDAFKGLSVFVGLMVSLGASSIIGQAASGFTLLYSRTMTVGDVVRIGDTEGVVQQIGLFTTRLRTPLGVEISFPNNVVLSGELRNYSRDPDGPGLWVETSLTIGYDAPWRQVHRLLKQAAADTDSVVAEPPPHVVQSELGDFAVTYTLRARVVDVAHRWQVRSALLAHIQDAFNAAGVQIMSPNYEADPASAKIVPKEHWDGRPPTINAP